MRDSDRPAIAKPGGAARVSGGRSGAESPGATLRRWTLGLLWSLKPPRLYGVPATLAMLAKYYAGLGLRPGALPDPDQALTNPDGLAGICTDLSVPTLMAAYAKGLFPLRSCRTPEMVGAERAHGLRSLENIHISKTTRRLLRLKQIRGDVRHGVRRGDQGLRRAASRSPGADLDQAGHHRGL